MRRLRKINHRVVYLPISLFESLSPCYLQSRSHMLKLSPRLWLTSNLLYILMNNVRLECMLRGLVVLRVKNLWILLFQSTTAAAILWLWPKSGTLLTFAMRSAMAAYMAGIGTTRPMRQSVLRLLLLLELFVALRDGLRQGCITLAMRWGIRAACHFYSSLLTPWSWLVINRRLMLGASFIWALVSLWRACYRVYLRRHTLQLLMEVKEFLVYSTKHVKLSEILTLGLALARSVVSTRYGIPSTDDFKYLI